MAINTSALNSTLQSRVDALDAATDTKEVLLLSKALDAAAGSTSVSDVLSEGVVQVNNVNSEGSAQIANVQNEGATQRASVGAVLGDYTPTTGFKTVGGQSVVGSGDIATLPSQSGASGKVLKSDGTNATWGTDEKGKLLNTTWVKITNRWEGTGATNVTITVTPTSASSTMIIQSYIMGETSTDRHDMSLRLHSSLGGYISDGSGNRGNGSVKLSEGGYTGSDYDSTPGNAFHQAMEVNTSLSNITYTWYVSRPDGGNMSNLTLQNSSNPNEESSPSWILVMEVE